MYGQDFNFVIVRPSINASLGLGWDRAHGAENITASDVSQDGRARGSFGRRPGLHGGGQGRRGCLTSMLLTPRPFSARTRKSPSRAIPLLRSQS
jgi:hypothetical protein